MLYRVIDLPYLPRRGRIDDEPLQRLIHGHRVVETRECFYEHEGLPHLLVAVRYELAPLGSSRSKPSTRSERLASGSSRDALTASGDTAPLPPRDAALFEKLRAWRTPGSASPTRTFRVRDDLRQRPRVTPTSPDARNRYPMAFPLASPNR